MTYITLAQAASIPNAPNRQRLTVMAKQPDKYPFFEKKNGKWMLIDNDDWKKYLAEKRVDLVLREPKPNAEIDQAELFQFEEPIRPRTKRKNTIDLDDTELSESAIEELKNTIIAQKARIAKLKADAQEMDNKVKESAYVHTETLNYWFSFIQRAIYDMFANFEKITPKVKQMFEEDKEKEAMAFLAKEFGRVFSIVMKELEKVQKNEDAE